MSDIPSVTKYIELIKQSTKKATDYLAPFFVDEQGNINQDKLKTFSENLMEHVNETTPVATTETTVAVVEAAPVTVETEVTVTEVTTATEEAQVEVKAEATAVEA